MTHRAAPSNTVGVNPDRSRILLYGLPNVLTLEIFSPKRQSVLVEWPLFRPLQIILDAAGGDIFEQSGRGFKQCLALTLAALFFVGGSTNRKKWRLVAKRETSSIIYSCNLYSDV